MVIVDRQRCGYCGGCVSLCPVEAIELAETRLVIDQTCTDCGLCLGACPVGALSLEGQEVKRGRQGLVLQRRYDVVVVGAGPAGSTAARRAAELGLSVLLLEKRQEIGSPVRCAEGVGHELLIPFIEPDEHWISATVDKAQFTTMVGDEVKTRRAEGGKGYVLERRVFDRVLAEKAVEAGAQLAVKTAARGLLMEDGVVRGVIVEGQGDVEIEAAVVIGADGVESRVGPWAGLDTTLPQKDAMACAQFLLSGINMDPTCCSYYISQELAPGGYAWVFPKGEGKANVGLGVQADMATRPALDYLTRFIEGQPHLAQGSPVTLVVGGVPVALPPERLVTDGCLLVGDAARQVDPLTGGGITNAMTAGQYAAEVAARAIEAGDTSAGKLAEYEERWAATLGRKMARNYRLKERFGPAQRASRDFIRLFAVAAGA
ncbi:MAG: geranylgeranyl reductase family protein [Anaerolineae bacterium]|nr:geranylgeranyl reductase family protein [Anaerolineae bacterium]